MVWPGEGLMVVGVIVGLEIAVVISGLVFTLVGDAWMLEIMELVSDAKGGFSVPPVWMPGLLATGWVPIVSLFPVAGRAVLLSLGSPTGIPIAGVVVPVFPVDEGGNARLPVAVLVGLLIDAVSAAFVPGIDTGFVDTGGVAVDPGTVGPSSDVLVVLSAGLVPGKDTGFVVTGIDTLLVVPGSDTLLVVPVRSDTGGDTIDGETVDPVDAILVAISVGFVPGTDTGFEVVCGFEIALAVSV